MNASEMARRLGKSVGGADVMTLSEFQRFMGLGKNTGKEKLAGVLRLYGKYYMMRT